MERDVFHAYLYSFHPEITGSRFLLTVFFPDGTKSRILIDCGYFQENQYKYMNFIDDINPKSIDEILITHNHIDHTGLIPKMVKNGYENPIHMTEFTKMLLPIYLYDSAEMQLNEEYNKKQTTPLYNSDDVKKTLDLCEGIVYEKTIEILPGIRITFFINGHILGASMILVECSAPRRKPINFLFTGDYKLDNPFFEVPKLPEWLRKKEIILIHESTFVNNISDDHDFDRQIIEALNEQKNVNIVTMAQEKMQECLYKLKKMQDDKLIPDYYEIFIDGNLGITTTKLYQKILETFNPNTSDFVPKGTKMISPNFRNDILSSNSSKIIVTAGNIFSNLNPEKYVILNFENDMHECKEKMIDFINSFDKVIFCGINHGFNRVKDSFAKSIKKKCPNVKMIDVMNRDYIYNIFQLSYSTDEYYNVKIKKMLVDLDSISWFKPKKSEIKRNNKRK